MNKFILILSFCAVLFTAKEAQAQKSNQEKTDSILALLPQLNRADKLNALADIININENLPADKYFTKMYLEEARKQKNIEAQGQALARLTTKYHLQFDTDSIFIFGDEAVRFCREHKLYDDLFSAQTSLIRRYMAEGKIITAIRKAEEAYNEAKQLNENFATATILATLADIYYTIDQYAEAARYWTESIFYFKKDETDEDRFGICMVYYFISCAYIYLNQPQKALQYADSMQTRIDRDLRLDPVFYNAQRDNFYKENQRAIAYAKLNMPELSYQAILRAEEVFDPQWNEISGLFAVQFDEMYGAYYHAKKNYNKALEHLTRLLTYYEESKSEQGIELTKKDMAQIYFEKGDYKSAAEIRLQIAQRKEEINNERFYAQINELRTLMELDKAEMESQRRLSAIRQQRTVIIGLSFACVAMILIVVLVVWSRRRIAEKNRSLYLQIKEQDSLAEELQQLKCRYEAFVETQGTASLQPQPQNGNAKQLQLVAHLHDYLLCDKNFTQIDMDYKDITTALATNKTYLFEAVKTITGKTLQEYINQLRLDEAKKMLDSHSKFTVEAIAMECGFNTYQTFYRLFKEKYKLTPTEYGKLAKKEG